MSPIANVHAMHLPKTVSRNRPYEFDATKFSRLAPDQTTEIKILDGSEERVGSALTATGPGNRMVERKISEGADICIEQIAGTARIESISVVEIATFQKKEPSRKCSSSSQTPMC